MRMRKKKWVSPFLENESNYLLKDLKSFKTDMPIYMEIGMGMGDFLCQSASLNPDIFYVGFEKEETCAARAIKKAQDKQLNNFKVLLANADNIMDICEANSIDRIYLHFPDPWPKKRNHKRRLTYMSFLEKYEKILKKNATLIYKTDNEEFFDDSLTYFEKSNFKLVRIDRNYINEDEPLTAYQEKFMAENKPIFYAEYVIS